jgi:hypothetical protein
MSFNLLEYLKNNPLLEELPKNKWVELDKQETQEYAGDIFDLIDKAYSTIGGNLNYQSPDDVTGSEGDANYIVIDLDDDPDPDAVVTYKNKSAGKKIGAMGHDNSSQAKSSSLNKTADILKKPGSFVEVSGKLKDILMVKGVPVVTNKTTIEKVMGDKALDIQDDGTYTRFIGDKKLEKILLGKPLI